MNPKQIARFNGIKCNTNNFNVITCLHFIQLYRINSNPIASRHTVATLFHLYTYEIIDFISHFSTYLKKKT